MMFPGCLLVTCAEIVTTEKGDVPFMCYDDNARPPIPPGEVGAAHGEDIVLTAADGNRFAAYSAHPAVSKGVQVLIYPDIRGLHQFYKELALRFAEIGIHALAIDYFGRTAGLTSRDDTFEYMPHVQQMTAQTFFADVEASLTYLRTGEGAARPTFVVGFCRGGSLGLLSGGREDFGFTGIVAFYAGLSRDIGGAGTILDMASGIKYPVLGLFGGADQGIPVEQVQQLDKELDAASVKHEIVIYPGAPHSFFDRRAVDFADASADAWKRVLAFVHA
jgi:carboxymethylenebutenolidase